MDEKGLINFDDQKMVETLKHTVAQGLSNEEFTLFAQFCKSTGLNPFKKEIWAIKAGGRLQIMTGIAGYLAIANSHPQFDGMEIEVETEKGIPTKAICKVHRKDRKYPSVGIALMNEFKGSSPIWTQKPSVMLTKVAKSIAIREAFPQELNGLYTEEEMPKEYAAPAVVVEARSATSPHGLEAKAALPGPDTEKGPFYYRFASAQLQNDKFKVFLERRGAEISFDGDWHISPLKLELDMPRLAECRIEKPGAIEEEDEIPDWHEEVNAKLPQKEVKETPLEKAKKRAAQMEKDSKGAIQIDGVVEQMNLGGK